MRHLLPNAIGPILVALTSSVVGAIVAESTLSFFGFGPQPGAGPARRSASARRQLEGERRSPATGGWWCSRAASSCCWRCINFIGDGLRDASDPKLSPALMDDAPLRQRARLPTPSSQLRDLRVTFPTMTATCRPCAASTSTSHAGELLGIVGESGSGKSVTFLGLMGLLPKSARIDRVGQGRRASSSSAPTPKLLNRVRGKRVAMIFQDPLSALNPVHRIGDQIVEMIQSHQDMSKKAAGSAVGRAARRGRHPAARDRGRQYPHEFSGGMRQRVMIAMAIANDPEVLIADEPTTALDVTVQAQILEVIQRIRRELNTAVVLITHDLGVVARVADRVQVMYAGRVAERGDVDAALRPSDATRTRAVCCESLPALGRERLIADPRLAAQHAAAAVRLRVPGPLPVRRRRLRRRAARAAPFGDLETACVRADELVDVPSAPP